MEKLRDRRLLAIALLVGLLSACKPNMENLFVQQLRDSAPGIAKDGSDAEVLRTGMTTCGLFDEGLSRKEVEANAVSFGASSVDATTLINLATTYLCGEHMSVN